MRRASRPASILTLVLVGLITIAHGAEPPISRDVVVYGATSAGIVAAIQARKLGRTVIVVEPGRTFVGCR